MRLFRLNDRRYGSDGSKADDCDCDRAHQKAPPLTSKPNDNMQSEASRPTALNNTTTLKGWVAVCALAASCLKAFATVMLMATSPSGFRYPSIQGFCFRVIS
jgi:hypothetical protein